MSAVPVSPNAAVMNGDNAPICTPFDSDDASGVPCPVTAMTQYRSGLCPGRDTTYSAFVLQLADCCAYE